MASQFPYPIAGIPDELPQGGGGHTVFDAEGAAAINRARLAHLEWLGLPIGGRTVLDVGCGVGHLAQFFVERGCRILCTDARAGNIARLRELYPGLAASVANVETDNLTRLGAFDIVFCYGLLYHLANPVESLTNIAAACGDLLLLETVICDHPLPVCRLADEPIETPNQAMGGLASRPSPSYVAMALTRLGFPFVYAPVTPPDHPDFQFKWRGNLEDSRDGHLLRCVFVASRRRIDNPRLASLSQTSDFRTLSPQDLARAARQMAVARPVGLYPGWYPEIEWNNPAPDTQMRRKLWEEASRRGIEVALDYEWVDGLRLDINFGDGLARQLFVGGVASPNQLALLDRFLQPGMTVIDAGAKGGVYTLFAARRVGASGAVLTFEPNPRELERLVHNIEINRLGNVRVRADTPGELQGAGREMPGGLTSYPVETATRGDVRGCTLDSAITEAGLKTVDFLKLDLDGGEANALRGATRLLREFRPVILIEVSDASLRRQGSSRGELAGLLGRAGYAFYIFDSSGLPLLANESEYAGCMLAAPAERPLPAEWCGTRAAGGGAAAFDFRPGAAMWRQRHALAGAQGRLRDLQQAVGAPSDLTIYQYGQLFAAALDFAPDLILELGRGRGNSTCVFTEAANRLGALTRVLSLCNSRDWERYTAPRLRQVLPPGWFDPLAAIRGDILKADYAKLLHGAKRVLLFWDASGFDVAECVLGAILPLLAPIAHVVAMHDISDNRYVADDRMSYQGARIWRGGNSGAPLKIGTVDSTEEQCVSALDFTTRNRLTFESADRSLREDLTDLQRGELNASLGDLFDTQGHWFYFSLNERKGPYRFPEFRR